MNISLVIKKIVWAAVLLPLLFVGTLLAQDRNLFTLLQLEGRVLYASKGEEKSHSLYLSAPRKINNIWRFERSEKISGTDISQTVEFEAGASFDDLAKHIHQSLKLFNARLLFACTGLDCGSSNVWANEVFKVKQLYGMDSTQDYSVWALEGEHSDRYAVVYLTRRGNKRVYLHAQLISSTEPKLKSLTADPLSILNSLEQNGYYVVAGDLQNPANNPHIKQIAQALKRKPLLQMAVVGHAHVHDSAQENESVSLAIANGVVEQLIVLGVPESRLATKGVGAWVPELGNKPFRVVLVTQ